MACDSPGGRRVLGLVALVLLCAGWPATASAARPCLGGRFLVKRRFVPIIAGVSSGSLDAIVIQGSTASLASVGGGCSAIEAAITTRRRGTRLRATWESCTGVAGGMSLTAWISRSCRAMKGVFHFDDGGTTHPFRARLSRCGDGVVDGDAGEECELADTATCDAVCHLRACDNCPCPSGAGLCNGTCVALQSDPTNCGDCGKVCPTAPNAAATCSHGFCGFVCAANFGSCDLDWSNGCETDFRSSAENCGRCARTCSAAQGGAPECVDSKCTVTCPTGLSTCGRSCVNLDIDALNCGACGSHCPAGDLCAAGRCTCPANQIECAGRCIDPSSNAANCSGCGRSCDPGEVCDSGNCTCPPERRTCTGRCIDVASDERNCGRCGAACPAGEVCESGTCKCPQGRRLCSKSCINPETDNSNCGGCGNICPSGEACVSGRCICPVGRKLCSGRCINLDTDRRNCGHCGEICLTGETCVSGHCG